MKTIIILILIYMLCPRASCVSRAIRDAAALLLTLSAVWLIIVLCG